MKKLTYLVASLLTTATVGMTFTGCIDNDEPYGIEQLRGAKAELLKSKKALVEADAQYKLALAEAARVEAAAKAALIDAERAKTEAEIAEIRQRMEAAALQAEQILARLQAEAELARLTYEQERLNLSGQQQTILDGFYAQYFNALDDYNTKYMDYVRAQKNLVDSAIDEDGSDYDAKKRVEKGVTDAQKALDDAQANIEDLNEQLADAKTWEPSELGAKYTAYQEQKDENTEKMKLIDLTIKQNENESEEGQALVAARKALTDANNEEVEIPAYTFNADGAITIPGLTEPREVIPEGWSYTWNTQYNYPGYNEAFNRLNNFKSDIRSYVLDDNDVEWTKAEINKLESYKEDATDTYDKAFAGWKMFADAYNVGGATKYDALTGYTELNAAIEAYNAQVPATQAAKDAYLAAKKDYNESLPASLKQDEEAYNKAIEDADNAYEAAQKAAQAELEKTRTTLSSNLSKAQKELSHAELQALKAQGLADQFPEDKDLEAKAKAANEAVEKTFKPAVAAAQKAYDEGMPKASDKYNKAVAVADADHEVAIDKAEKAWELAQEANNAQSGPLWNKYSEARDKFDEAFATLKELGAYSDGHEEDGQWVEEWKGAIYEAVFAQIDQVTEDTRFWGILDDNYNWGEWTPGTNTWNVENFGWGVMGSYWNEDESVPECSIDDVCAFNKASIEDNIIALSRRVYGSYYQDKYDDDALNIPSAQLIPLTKDDIDKMLAKYGVDEINYPNSYNYYFGLFGITLYYDNRIEVANTYITNKPVIEAAFEDVQTQIDNLVATYDEQKEKIDEAGKAVDAAQEAVDELNADSWAEYYELQRQNDVADKMIIAISAAAEATGVAQTEQWTQETIDAAIENIEQSIKDEEESIPDLEEALARAKYILDQYEKGLISSAELAALDVEEAKLAMDAAKEKLDAAKARLDAAIKSVENAE